MNKQHITYYTARYSLRKTHCHIAGNTALHSCVLNHYSSLRMRDRDDFTAVARNLLECGSEPNARNTTRSETPLHLAARLLRNSLAT